MAGGGEVKVKILYDLDYGPLRKGNADAHALFVRSQAEQTREFDSQLGKRTQAHATALKTQAGHWDMYKAGALASIKTVEQYRQDWSKKSTKELVAHIKELQDKRVDEQLFIKRAAAEADAVQTRIHKNRLEQLSLENRALKQVSIERAEVQRRGEGGIIGQLGTGREEIFKQLARGFGGSALIGKLEEVKKPLEGFADMSAPTKSLAVFGVAALAAAEGVKLLYEFGEKTIEWARRFEEGEDRLAIALTRTNLSQKDQHAELKFLSKDVDEISNSFARPRAEIAQTMATVAAFSRQGGGELKHLTEVSIGASEALGVNVEMVAKFIGRGANPEIEAQLSRIGIHVEKNSTAQERLTAIYKAFGNTVDETKERMDEGVHSWDRLVNQLTNARDKFADEAFKALSPEFKKLNPLIKEFTSNLAKTDFSGFKRDVADIIGLIRGVGHAVTFTESLFTRNAENSAWVKLFTPGKAAELAAKRKLYNAYAEIYAAGDEYWANQERTQIEGGLKSPDPNAKKEGKGSDSNAALYETIRAQKWMREERLKDNEKANKDEEQQELDFLKLQSLRSTNKIEETVGNEKESAKAIYEEKKKFLIAERDTAALYHGETSKEAESFNRELEQLEHERILRQNKDAADEVKAQEKKQQDLKKLRETIEDKGAALIADKQKREEALETLRFNREMEQAKDSLELRRLIEREHWDAMAKIRQDAEDKANASYKSIVEAGLQPFNRALTENAAIIFKDTNLIAQMANGIVSAAGKIIQEKAALAIFKAIFGDDEKKSDNSNFFQAISAGPGFTGPRHAAGTDDAPGGMSLVGENGPEIVNLQKGAQVIPNNQLGSLGLASLASSPIKVNKPNSSESTRTAAPYIPSLADTERANAFTSKQDKQDEQAAKYFGTTVEKVREARATQSEKLKELVMFAPEEMAGLLGGEALMGTKLAGAALRPFGHGLVGKVIHGAVHHSAEAAAKKIFNSIFGNAPHHADGTDDAPGGISMVGERGVEAVLPPKRQVPRSAYVATEPGAGKDSQANKTLLAIAQSTKMTADHTGIMQQGITGNKGVHKAAGAAKGLMSSLSPLLGLIPGAGPVLEGLGAGLNLFADGTDFAPGGRAIVGERGPELINLPRGSKVTPNHKLSVNEPARGGSYGFAGGSPGGMGHIDYDRLSTSIANANRSLPPPLIDRNGMRDGVTQASRKAQGVNME